MILLDALYINNGGGKVLLNYLINQLLDSDLEIFFLLDDRCDIKFNSDQKHKVVYEKASILNRYKFYKRNKNSFSKILCFANIPPPIKINNATVYTYFHNILIIDLYENYGFVTKTKVKLRKKIWRSFRENSDFWMVQTKYVNSRLSKELSLKDHEVLELPFFEILDKTSEKSVRNGFLYVSSGALHKNHKCLLEAWDILFSKNLVPELHLTLSDDWIDLLDTIDDLNKKGLKIINHGMISSEEVASLYRKSEYTVYPSLSESFGLPLVESVNYGCDILASDLPYVFEVVKPSATFDPLNPNEIADVIASVIKTKPNSSLAIINNEINTLINVLY